MILKRKCITEKLTLKMEMHRMHLLFKDFSISLPSQKRRILLYGFSAFEMQIDGDRKGMTAVNYPTPALTPRGGGNSATVMINERHVKQQFNQARGRSAKTTGQPKQPANAVANSSERSRRRSQPTPLRRMQSKASPPSNSRHRNSA